jgi:hypothetical protein
MKKLLVVVMLAVALVLPIGAPAQAHFERGGNCHFENISARGVITMRFTNRTYLAQRVRCILDFDRGRNGYMWANVAPRSWRIGRHRFYGSWQTVEIIHVHLTRLV